MSMSSTGKRRRNVVILTAVISALFYLALFHTADLQSKNEGDYATKLSNYTINDVVSSLSHRKLLSSERSVDKPDRYWGPDGQCTNSDIQIDQGPTKSLPSGIPTCTVFITNICRSHCNISDIHLKCGWFSSARLIDPLIFKRLDYNDCLVNGGRPLENGKVITFQYANSRPYPLDLSSMKCL